MIHLPHWLRWLEDPLDAPEKEARMAEQPTPTTAGVFVSFWKELHEAGMPPELANALSESYADWFFAVSMSNLEHERHCVKPDDRPGDVPPIFNYD